VKWVDLGEEMLGPGPLLLNFSFVYYIIMSSPTSPKAVLPTHPGCEEQGYPIQPALDITTAYRERLAVDIALQREKIRALELASAERRRLLEEQLARAATKRARSAAASIEFQERDRRWLLRSAQAESRAEGRRAMEGQVQAGFGPELRHKNIQVAKSSAEGRRAMEGQVEAGFGPKSRYKEGQEERRVRLGQQGAPARYTSLLYLNGATDWLL
jgi:hypothetical protein